MKILLICNKAPWPPREGGPIAMNAMAEGLLAAGHQVKILAINSYKYNIPVESIPEEYRDKTGIELVFMDLRVKPLAALKNIFTDRSYHVERFISKDFSDALERILKSGTYDIIQFETLFVTPYIDLIRRFTKAPVILRAHNIEHLIWQRLSKGEKNPFRRWYLKHLADTLMKYELDTIKKLDGIVTITDKDAEFFESYLEKQKVIAIPFGIQPEKMAKYTGYKGEEAEMSLFHLGSMNWIPNQEAIRWFLKEVWPTAYSQHNNLMFRVAGREMPDWLATISQAGVINDGDVPDAVEYMHKHRVMIVPLFSGSGIRIKIIEGMMAGCAIITTSIGAEGINCKNGEHLLIAETAGDFISCINRLVEDPDFAKELGRNASEFVKKEHNNSYLIKKLESFYNALHR